MRPCSGGADENASQFLITSNEDCDALDEKHTVFGQVSEGLDVLAAINEAYCDEAGRPWWGTGCMGWVMHGASSR